MVVSRLVRGRHANWIRQWSKKLGFTLGVDSLFANMQRLFGRRREYAEFQVGAIGWTKTIVHIAKGLGVTVAELRKVSVPCPALSLKPRQTQTCEFRSPHTPVAG